MKLALLLAVLALVGCDTARQKVSYTEWPQEKPRYTIHVSWDCDSLPDTLKVAVPK